MSGKKTQNQMILETLKRRPKMGIDNNMARQMGIMRLSERIFELEASGVMVERVPFTVKKNGQTYNMVRYVLDPYNTRSLYY